MDVAVFRRQIAGAIKSLGGSLIVSLAERQQTPVGPTSGFSCSELRKLRELGVSLYVMTNLKRCKADVKSADELVVLRRRSGWEIATRTAKD